MRKYSIDYVNLEHMLCRRFEKEIFLISREVEAELLKPALTSWNES